MNELNTLVNEVVAENTNKATMGTSPAEEAKAGTLPSQTVTSGSHNPMEKVYQTRYPLLAIVPGSMIQEKDHPVYKNKVRVDVVCGVSFDGGPKCTEVVHRATSDLHTFLGCESCKKVVRKLNKAKNALAALAAK